MDIAQKSIIFCVVETMYKVPILVDYERGGQRGKTGYSEYMQKLQSM